MNTPKIAIFNNTKKNVLTPVAGSSRASINRVHPSPPPYFEVQEYPNPIMQQNSDDTSTDHVTDAPDDTHAQDGEPEIASGESSRSPSVASATEFVVSRQSSMSDTVIDMDSRASQSSSMSAVSI